MKSTYEAFCQQNLNDSLALVAFSVSTETPKAALDETSFRAGLMRISLPMALDTALPRLRSIS